ncbi:MAG: type II toxin-antitoxin system RelE/ParE family toxin [Planctomycetes bacterium]|nr:type II toxin-antitoxin system RelE/ParE family toxin [Planctomycetota bacterium]
MASISWTKKSELMLQEILEYIAKDSPAAALRFAEGVFKKLNTIETFPDAGSHWANTARGEQRCLVYGRYKIAYLILSENDLQIVAIFDCARDISGSF